VSDEHIAGSLASITTLQNKEVILKKSEQKGLVYKREHVFGNLDRLLVK